MLSDALLRRTCRVLGSSIGPFRRARLDALVTPERIEEPTADDAAPGIGTRTLLAGALVGIGGTLLAGALGVARTKVLAVELDPDGLGLYGQLFSLLSALSAVTGLGLGLGTTKVVAASRARGDERTIGLALSVSAGLPLVIGLALAVMIASLSLVLAPLLLRSNDPGLILIAAVAIPFIAVQGPLIHGLQGLKDVRGVQGATVAFGFVFTSTSAIGAVLGGLDGAVAALVISNAAFLLFLALRLKRLVSPLRIRIDLREGLRPSWLRDPTMRNMLAIGVASLVVGVAGGLTDIVARTILLRAEGEAVAGIYQSLTLISTQVVGVVVTAVVFFSFASVSESAAVDDQSRTVRQTDDALRLSLLLTLPVIMIIGLFREELVPIFLSPEFGETAQKLPLQLTGDAARTVAWVLGAALVPVGLTRWFVAIAVAATAIFLGLVVVLVPGLGLSGVLVANVVLWALSAVLTAIVLTRAGQFRVTARAAGGLVMGVGLVAVLFLESLNTALAFVTLVLGSAILLLVVTSSVERGVLRTRVVERLPWRD